MNNNRIRFAPINTGMYQSRNSTPENEAFYRERSSSLIDIAIVGNVSVSADLCPNENTGLMSSHHAWGNLATSIRERGAMPGIQIASICPGYTAQRKAYGLDMPAALEDYRRIVKAITACSLAEVARAFKVAIDQAVAHSFDHIQIHAAHGYLWSLILDPAICQNKNLLCYFHDILEHLLAKGIHASLRLSWKTGFSHDDERQDAIHRLIMQYPQRLDWDISNGYYNADKRFIYPERDDGHLPWKETAGILAGIYPNEHFVFSGNVWDPATALLSLPRNVSLGIARPLIADPRFLEPQEGGRHKKCNYCGHCHYFTRGCSSITCPHWRSTQIKGKIGANDPR